MDMQVSTMLSTLPPVIERYELKYVIPYSLVEPISDYLAPYCAYDHHSMAYADRFYPVNSLYFDTPNHRFLKQRMYGVDRRFNMRVRAYGDGEEGPYFAEIKFKSATSVKKFRATLQATEWPGFLSQDSQSLDLSNRGDKENISRQTFMLLAEAYAIEPKIFTCYRRRAFLSLIDEYARVTFDINMRYRPQDPLHATDLYSLNSSHGCINYDTETIYDDEAQYNSNVVLELKATIGAVPVWMIELIRRFELKQVGFSKYMHSSLVDHFDNGWRYMGADRMGACYH